MVNRLSLSNAVNFSWDVSEAIRMHIVAKQPLPENIQGMLTSHQSSWKQLSSMLQLCVHSHSQQLVGCDDGDGAGSDGVGGGDGESREIGDSGDMCAVVMMGHVCRVLEEYSKEMTGDGARSTVSLYIMSHWVESSRLATPTQQLKAKTVSRGEVSCSATAQVCHSAQILSGLQGDMETQTETCPICTACILYTYTPQP